MRPDHEASPPRHDGGSPTHGDEWHNYEWIALSVTTVGALLASIQGLADIEPQDGES